MYKRTFKFMVHVLNRATVIISHPTDRWGKLCCLSVHPSPPSPQARRQSAQIDLKHDFSCCTNLLFSPYHTDISPKKYVCVFNFTNFERIDRFWKIYVRYASNIMRVFWSFFFQMNQYHLPHLHPGACSSPSQQRYLKVQPGIPARRWQQVWMVWQPKSGIIFCYQIHPKMKRIWF